MLPSTHCRSFRRRVLSVNPVALVLTNNSLRAGYSKVEPNFVPVNFGTATYRPSLVKIDARNFELSW